MDCTRGRVEASCEEVRVAEVCDRGEVEVGSVGERDGLTRRHSDVRTTISTTIGVGIGVSRSGDGERGELAILLDCDEERVSGVGAELLEVAGAERGEGSVSLEVDVVEHLVEIVADDVLFLVREEVHEATGVDDVATAVVVRSFVRCG